jgi:hypothetical protein
MSRNILAKDDLRSIIKYTVENDVLDSYKDYWGCKVIEVLDDGIVKCFIPEIGAMEENIDGLVYCKNGTNYFSNIVPEKGDYLIVRKGTGNINLAYYVGFDPTFYEVINKDKDKVIFEYEKAAVYYEDGSLVLVNDDSKVTLNKSNIEFMVKGLFNNSDVTIKNNEVKIKTKTLKLDGDLEVTGDVDVEKEVTAKYKTAPVGLTTHTATGNLGAQTSSPTVGT